MEVRNFVTNVKYLSFYFTSLNDANYITLFYALADTDLITFCFNIGASTQKPAAERFLVYYTFNAKGYV